MKINKTMTILSLACTAFLLTACGHKDNTISFDDNLIIYLMINTLPYVFLKKIFLNKKQMIDRLMIASLCITAWLLL